MEISVMLSTHWVTSRKAIEYHEKHLKIAIEIGGRAEKDEPMEISVMLTSHWVTSEKPLSIMKKT